MFNLKCTLEYLFQKKYRRKDILKLQKKRFYKLLLFAYNNSPFYQQYYNEHGINKRNLAEVEVSDLPLMNKTLLMDNLDNIFTDRTLNKKSLENWISIKEQRNIPYKNKYYVIFSSGTSLNSSIIVYDKKIYEQSLISTYYRILEANPFVKTKAIYLSSSAAALIASSRLSAIMNTEMLSFTTDNFDENIDIMNRFKPKVLIASPSFLDLLLEKAGKGILKIKPSKIFLHGECVSPIICDEIRSLWGVEPIDVYGAAELTTIGYRESMHEDYTVFDDYNILEVLNENNVAVESGDTGRAVLTNLTNSVTPIIRYDLGDNIVTCPKSASGGIFQKIRNVGGRISEALLPMIIHDGSKSYVHPERLDEFYVQGMKKCQYIFSPPNCITINFVAEEDYHLEDKIKEEFNKILLDQDKHHQTQIQVKRLDSLMIHPGSGKLFRVMIKKL